MLQTMAAAAAGVPGGDDRWRDLRKQIDRLRQLIHKKSEKQNKTQNILQETAMTSDNLYQLQPQSQFKIRRKFEGHFGKIYALDCASNSQQIVTASQDGTLLIWNVDTMSKLTAIPLKNSFVMTTAYSPNKRFVASGGLDNTCTIYDIKDLQGWNDSQKPYKELQKHEGYVSGVRFMDDNQILSCSGDSSIILWDIEKAMAIHTFIGHNEDVECIDINQENSLFISGGIDTFAKVWDYRTNGDAILNFRGHNSDINCISWFPNKNAFASGSDDSTIRLFDLRAYQQISCFGNQDIYSCSTSVAFSKSGYYLLAAYDEEPGCIVWNTMTNVKEAVLDHKENRVSCLQTAPNGYYIASGCWDKLLRLWA
eukprot:73147_1